MTNGPQASRQPLLHTPAGTDPDDPWLTSNGAGYDPDKVYARASDGHGHSEVLTVRVSPALAAVLREVIEKVSDYHTKSDVVRDALVHRLHQINAWPAVDIRLQPLQWEIVQQQIDSGVENHRTWEHLIESGDRYLDKLINEGDYDTAVWQLEQFDGIDYMTVPYLQRLGVMTSKHRARIRYYQPEDTGNHD